MSAAQLADKAGAGLTRSLIANLENGRKADLSVQQLFAIADALGVAASSLVGAGDRLRAAFASWESARTQFQDSLRKYVESLLEVALEADRADSLAEQDRSWFETGLAPNSPARLTSDAPRMLSAAIRYDGLPIGVHVKRLTELLELDAERIGHGEHQAEA